MELDNVSTTHEMLNFGNPRPPKGTIEQPLVTFALFAYNQESFIDEAVNSALAQTYSPLEIILSDDCSSDSTYEAIKRLATSYVGPHKIIIRRNAVNMGLAAHINIVATLAKGHILVMAAGDDRSDVHRTEKLVNEFVTNPSVQAVFSAYEVIPSKATDCGFGSFYRSVTTTEIIAAGGGVQIGATYAYKLDALLWPTPLPEWIKSEDRILPLRASVLGGVRYLPDQLVAYRVSTSSIERNQKRARNRMSTMPQHSRNIRDILIEARAENKISFSQYLLYASLNSLVRLSNQFRRSGAIGLVYARILYLLVGLFRVTSRLRMCIVSNCKL